MPPMSSNLSSMRAPAPPERPEEGLLVAMGVCAMFGTGAAAGAFLTERVPTLTLIVPIAALLLVLLLCARWHPVEVARG
jgi:uncharacterized membrane protein YoaK (UPF0700 family)